MNAMVQFSDPYWEAALEQALRALAEAECVLVPSEFLHLDSRFAPLEFSWGLEPTSRLAWCCPKPDVDKLAPWLHDSALDPTRCRWSNEVFVLGGNFAWSAEADALSKRHLPAWYERVQRYRAGVPARSLRVVKAQDTSPVPQTTTHGRKRVLLVGASGMGNVGDDLLASVLSGMLSVDSADVDISGPDIDPFHVAGYDAVFVGGGGLVYASRAGTNECQNLANYLKFGPIAHHFGIPAALIGIGDQDHEQALLRKGLSQDFARGALEHFQLITTRDEQSADLLRQLGARHVTTGSDPVFALTDRARAAVRPTANQPARLALIGEFYDYAAFRDGLGDGDGALATTVRDGDFDLVIMSNDDVAHCKRLQKALRRTGASAALVDLRGKPLDALIFLFASYQGVITTRFHGLVLAAMCGVPVVALDDPHGKKARLLREFGAESALITNESPSAAVAHLSGALSGGLSQIPAASVDRMKSLSDIHRASMQQLVCKARLPAESDLRTTARPSNRHAATDVVSSMEHSDAGAINLCWAASSEETQGFGNLGDSLSAVMVAALSGRHVCHTNFDEDRAKLVAVGSIGHAIRNGTAVVWGTGVSIRGGTLAESVRMTRYDIRAIRGPISAQHFRDFGIPVPDVYGDPVWLLPSILNEPVEKKYELGVIPHIQDIEQPHPDAPPKQDSLRYVIEPGDRGDIAIINTWHEPTWEGLLAKIRLIRSCKRILSQSFHGVVIAEAYGIPVLNFRHLPGAKNGLTRVDLNKPCTTDPRIWEFFKSGRAQHFQMYAQRRDARSDWAHIIRMIDTTWEPFSYDARGLVESFPLPLSYDPLSSTVGSLAPLQNLRF